MIEIKKARNSFYGVWTVISADEFDGYMYVLDLASSHYEEISKDKLETCLKLIRILTEVSIFDIENRVVHIQLGYKEMSFLAQALYDAMMVGLHPVGEHSFDACIQRHDVKIWEDRSKKNK